MKGRLARQFEWPTSCHGTFTAKKKCTNQIKSLLQSLQIRHEMSIKKKGSRVKNPEKYHRTFDQPVLRNRGRSRHQRSGTLWTPFPMANCQSPMATNGGHWRLMVGVSSQIHRGVGTTTIPKAKAMVKKYIGGHGHH